MKRAVNIWMAAATINVASWVLAGGGWLAWRAIRSEPRDCTPAARPYVDGEVVFDYPQHDDRRPWTYGIWKRRDGTFLMDARGHMAFGFTERMVPVASWYCLDDLAKSANVPLGNG